MTTKQSVNILFVCSANLCRSVTAAEFARRAAGPLTASPVRWRFASAGVHVVPGQRLPARTESAMRDLGIPVHHRPRPVDESSVRTADLILTAERTHRGKVVERFPFAVRSTYTLLQFARLVEAGRAAAGDDVELSRLAQIGQANVQALEDDTIDIADPVGDNTTTSMLHCAELIEIAIEQIVR